MLLNGPPGIGKSTVARGYAAAVPGALCLDVDELRSRVPGWRTSLVPAGLSARATALDLARAHLLSGSDVVVPQYVARPAFLDQLSALAGSVGARFHELCLTGSRAASLARFTARGDDPLAAGHHHDALEQAGGLEGVARMHDELLAFLATRSQAVRIATDAHEVGDSLTAVLRAVGADLP